MTDELNDRIPVAVMINIVNSQRLIGSAIRRRNGSSWIIELIEFYDNEQVLLFYRCILLSFC